MKDLIIIFLGKEQEINLGKNIGIIFSNGSNLNETIENANAKYITFIKEEDKIDAKYLPEVVKVIKTDFDCCFINYSIDYNYKNDIKILTDKKILKDNIPYVGEYLWSFIFNKNKLVKLLNQKNNTNLNQFIEEEFKDRTAIGNVIYFHNPKGEKKVKNFLYCDVKRNEYFKNIIYISHNCNGTFNGYISWLKHLGRCFGDKYSITFLYDEGNEETLKMFTKNKIKCVKRSPEINYVCDRLLLTYSDYHYKKNIFALEENMMFIHGNMSDYDNSAHYKNDIYSRYIAVSKVTAEKAKGYFPTDNIEDILNPYKLDKKDAAPHLKLVSAQRSTKIKCPERIEQLAAILDELNIPYTWNVFSDTKENTNKGGVIYRKRTRNPLPYVKDADYFVLLSDSEAMPYCILEALSVNTKVVVTPLETYKQLGIKDKKHGVIIPFDYFKEENKDKLVKIVKRMYKDKDKKIRYRLDKKLYEGYNTVFKA